MKSFKAPLGKLKVMPDPELAELHPLHQSRFIATDDAQWDDYHPNKLARGSIIARLTDCEFQAQYARVMAAAPELLHTLRSTTAALRSFGADCTTLDAILSRFSDIA
jgi:hypothetical protein